MSLAAQYLRFVGCAGIAALVNFAAGSLLVDGCGLSSRWQFPLAVAAAYALGMAINFSLNRRFTFASDRHQLDQMRSFVAVALSGLALTMLVAALARALLADIAELLPAVASPETASRAVAIALVSLYSFAAHKHLTFNRGIRLPLLRLVRALPFGA